MKTPAITDQSKREFIKDIQETGLNIFSSPSIHLVCAADVFIELDPEMAGTDPVDLVTQSQALHFIENEPA